jgi:DNA polymerase III subunit epsilon
LVGWKGFDMNKVLWLDTETTGLNPKKHGLREIGYIMIIDGQVVEKDVLYINPRTYKKGIEIDIRALELSNITIDDFYYYADSNCVFDDFRVILDKYSKGEKFILAGFNVKFDNDFLREWFYDNNAGVDFKDYFHYKVIDVFPLVITLKHLGFIDTVDDKLKTVCEHFNIKIDAHNALSDIEATKNLYELIADRFINDKEVFKQKEFEYRTKCQEILSSERLDADNINYSSIYRIAGYGSDGKE